MLFDFGLAKALAPESIQRKDIETSYISVLCQINSLRLKCAVKITLSDKLHFKSEAQDTTTGFNFSNRRK
jgi:hypothetical protein